VSVVETRQEAWIVAETLIEALGVAALAGLATRHNVGMAKVNTRNGALTGIVHLPTRNTEHRASRREGLASSEHSG